MQYMGKDLYKKRECLFFSTNTTLKYSLYYYSLQFTFLLKLFGEILTLFLGNIYTDQSNNL